MAKLLFWLPAGGLAFMLLLLLLSAGLAALRGPGKIADGAGEEGPELVLILEDCQEQVEMLVRWLEFRRRWQESPVAVTFAVAGAAGDTPAILERLHKEGVFQITTENGWLRTGQEQAVLRLTGREPVPWEELALKLQGRQESIA